MQLHGKVLLCSNCTLPLLEHILQVIVMLKEAERDLV